MSNLHILAECMCLWQHMMGWEGGEAKAPNCVGAPLLWRPLKWASLTSQPPKKFSNFIIFKFWHWDNRWLNWTTLSFLIRLLNKIQRSCTLSFVRLCYVTKSELELLMNWKIKFFSIFKSSFCLFIHIHWYCHLNIWIVLLIVWQSYLFLV